MKRTAIIILLSVFFLSSGAQRKSSDSLIHSRTIKEQAEIMAQSLLKKDFKSFTKFTYPKIVEMIGGEQKMIEVLENGSREMESEGTRFLHVAFGEPSAIVVKENQLQCTLPQIIEIKVPNGRLVSKSTLIAISTDKGKTWYYIDTAGKDIQTLRQALPNLSEELLIPEKQEPTFYKD